MNSTMHRPERFFSVKGPHFTGSGAFASAEAAENAIRDLIAYRRRVFGGTYTRDCFEIHIFVDNNDYVA